MLYYTRHHGMRDFILQTADQDMKHAKQLCGKGVPYVPGNQVLYPNCEKGVWQARSCHDVNHVFSGAIYMKHCSDLW